MTAQKKRQIHFISHLHFILKPLTSFLGLQISQVKIREKDEKICHESVIKKHSSAIQENKSYILLYEKINEKIASNTWSYILDLNII